MKLTKIEKVQFVYDFIGSAFCAFMLGFICTFLINPSSHRQFYTDTNWQRFHFFLPFIFYFVFLWLFWKSPFLSRFRLNSLWIFVNFFSSATSLFFSFLIRDLANHRFLTDQSKFVPFGEFLYFIGLIILGIIFFASCFWYIGWIHRTVIENRSQIKALNFEN